MSKSLNRVELIGNLGADPEVRSTSGGANVATLSVATNRTWTDADGNEESATAWHRVVLWDGLADVADRYLSTGDRVYIAGRIEYRTWEGDDGRERRTTEIRGREMIMLGGGREQAGPKPDREPEPAPAGPTADDLPF